MKGEVEPKTGGKGVRCTFKSMNFDDEKYTNIHFSKRRLVTFAAGHHRRCQISEKPHITSFPESDTAGRNCTGEEDNSSPRRSFLPLQPREILPRPRVLNYKITGKEGRSNSFFSRKTHKISEEIKNLNPLPRSINRRNRHLGC